MKAPSTPPLDPENTATQKRAAAKLRAAVRDALVSSPLATASLRKTSQYAMAFVVLDMHPAGGAQLDSWLAHTHQWLREATPQRTEQQMLFAVGDALCGRLFRVLYVNETMSDALAVPKERAPAKAAAPTRKGRPDRGHDKAGVTNSRGLEADDRVELDSLFDARGSSDDDWV